MKPRHHQKQNQNPNLNNPNCLFIFLNPCRHHHLPQLFDGDAPLGTTHRAAIADHRARRQPIAHHPRSCHRRPSSSSPSDCQSPIELPSPTIEPAASRLPITHRAAIADHRAHRQRLPITHRVAIADHRSRRQPTAHHPSSCHRRPSSLPLATTYHPSSPPPADCSSSTAELPSSDHHRAAIVDCPSLTAIIDWGWVGGLPVRSSTGAVGCWVHRRCGRRLLSCCVVGDGGKCHRRRLLCGCRRGPQFEHGAAAELRLREMRGRQIEGDDFRFRVKLR
ncbi:hypothetical protein Dimus_008131 [Dionaea muscipula]